MRKTIKNILLILIMIVMGISFPHVCTTVDAEEFNLSDYQYKYYCNSASANYPNYDYIVAVSNKKLSKIAHNGSYSYVATDLNTNLTYSIAKSSSHYFWGVSSMYFPIELYILTYEPINGWEIHLPWVMTGGSTNLICWNISYDFFSTSVPSGMPEIVIDDIDSAIKGVLNDTTQTTTTANNLQNSLASDYSAYKAGNITSETLQVSVDNTVSQLNSLNDNSGNTLADLISINNGLTYAQTVQDKINADEIIETQNVTSTVQTNINGYITQANNAYSQFIAGNITQSEAINTIQQQIINLNNMIGNQATKAADVAAVNAAINTVQNTSNSVHNYSELDKSVSDKAQKSDQEELEYLDSLETTSTIQDMSPSQQMQTQSQSGNVQPLLSIVWDNELIKIILPLTAGFLVISVALGRKFKL